MTRSKSTGCRSGALTFGMEQVERKQDKSRCSWRQPKFRRRPNAAAARKVQSARIWESKTLCPMADQQNNRIEARNIQQSTPFRGTLLLQLGSPISVGGARTHQADEGTENVKLIPQAVRS